MNDGCTASMESQNEIAEVEQLVNKIKEYLEYTLLFENLSLKANLRRMQLIDYIEDVELSASLKSLLQQQTDASHRGDGTDGAVGGSGIGNTECSCNTTMEDKHIKEETTSSLNDSVFLPNPPAPKLPLQRLSKVDGSSKAASSMPDILSAHAINKPGLARRDSTDSEDKDDEIYGDCYLSPVIERPVPHSDDSFSQSWSTDEEDVKWDMKDDLADLAERGSRFSRARGIRNRDKKGLFRKWSHRPGGALAAGLARARSLPSEEAPFKNNFDCNKMGTSASTGNGGVVQQKQSGSAGNDLEVDDNVKAKIGSNDTPKHLFSRTWDMTGLGMRKTPGFEERSLSLPPKNYITTSRSAKKGRQVRGDKDDVKGRRGRASFFIGECTSSDQSMVEKLRAANSHINEKFVVLANSRKVKRIRRATFNTKLLYKLKGMVNQAATMDSGYLRDVVTMSSMEIPDKKGWLTDMSTGEDKFCILADMLLCVFDGECDEHPSKVIMMPGQIVKATVYSSAKPDKLSKPHADPTKTLSGFTRFQVTMHNQVTSEKNVFGTGTQGNLNGWVDMLDMASKLDTNIFDDDEFEDNEYMSDILHSSDRSDITGASSPDSNCSSLNTHSRCSSSDLSSSFQSIENRNILTRPASFLHTPTVFMNGATRNDIDCESRKGSPVFKKVQRTRSCQRIESPNKPEPERSAGEPRKSRALQRSNGRVPRPRSVDSAALVKDKDSVATHARGSSEERSGFGRKLAKKANSFREKVFGNKSKVEKVDDIYLQHTEDSLISGYLQLKHLLKWSRLWCTVSQGTFTCYKSNGANEKPVLSIPLQESSLQAVENDKSRKMFVFKLCQLYAKSTYLAAENLDEFTNWMTVLRKFTLPFETTKILQTRSSHQPRRTQHKKLFMSNPILASSAATYGSKRGSFEPTEPVQGMKGSVSANWSEEYTRALPKSCSSSSVGSASAMSVLSAPTRLGSHDTQSEEQVPVVQSPPHSPYKSHKRSPSKPSCPDFQKPKVPVSRAQSMRHDSPRKPSMDSPRGYQLQSLKSQLTVLPSRPVISGQTPQAPPRFMDRSDLMTYLDGAQESSVDDEVQEELLTPSKKIARSYSDGTLCFPESMKKLSKNRDQIGPVVIQIAARELNDVKASNYLDRRNSQGEWESCWCVINGESLYIYDSAIDEETLDVIPLKEYHLRKDNEQPDAYKHWLIVLQHQEHRGEYLAAEDESEFTHWCNQLEQVTKEEEPNSQPTKHHDTPSGECKDLENNWRSDLWKMRRQKLLLEVVRQKQEIETRQKCKKVVSTQLDNTLNDDLLDDEKVLKNRTLVRQKRLSMQLKRDKLEKFLEKYKSSSTKKNGKFHIFKRGFTQKTPKSNKPQPPTPEQEQVAYQLQQLTEKLEHLNKLEKESEITRNRRSAELLSMDSELNTSVKSRYSETDYSLKSSRRYTTARRCDSADGVGYNEKDRRGSDDSLAELIRKGKNGLSVSSLDLSSSNDSLSSKLSTSCDTLKDLNNNRNVQNSSFITGLKVRTMTSSLTEGDTSPDCVLVQSSLTVTETSEQPERASGISEQARRNIAEFEELLQEKMFSVQL